MNECFISVDIETTGPTPGKYSMYELGACVVGEEEECFEKKVKLLSKNSYDPKTLAAMHIADVGVLLERTGTYTGRKTMRAFADWVKKVAGEQVPIFVANNAPFDWMFVAWYFKRFGVENPFGHAALDMKAYFMGCTSSSWEGATLAAMTKHAGVTCAKLPHRALDDAIIQSKIFARLLLRTKNEHIGTEGMTPTWDLNKTLERSRPEDMLNGIEHPKKNCPKCGAPPEEQEVHYYYRRNDPRIYCNRCNAFVPDLYAG